MAAIAGAGYLRPGARLHRLVVVSLSHIDDRRRKFWSVICDCGVSKIVQGSAMVSGRTKSCGCLSRETKRTSRLDGKVVIGGVFPTNNGGSVTVIEYRDGLNIKVRNNDNFGHESNTCKRSLLTGSIKNPYKPSVHGYGFIGVGKYKVRSGGEKTPAYKSWSCLLERAYSAKLHHKYPTYINASVSECWHNYQNFAAWFYGQPNSERRGFSLDKDLIVGGNKVYGPDTCSFVPNSINMLLVNCSAQKGLMPIGVSVSGSGFQARVAINGRQKDFGSYATPEEAYEAYRKAKESRVRSLAEEWRRDLDPRVYGYLKGWKVPDFKGAKC